MRLLQTAGGRPEVALYTDAGGKPGQLVGLLQIAGRLGGVPGNVLFVAPMSAESFSGSGEALRSMMDLPPGASVGDFDGDFVASGTRPSGLALKDNSNYWLVVRSTSGEFAQVYTDQEKGAGLGFTPEWADSTTSGKQWTNHELSPLLYQVMAEVGVPIIEFRIDNEAIFSAIASGLPMALVQRETVFAATETATRDVNARLFRLRSGIAEPSPGKWEIFVAGNYSARENDTIGMTTGFDADVWTSTAGFEFRPCRASRSAARSRGPTARTPWTAASATPTSRASPSAPTPRPSGAASTQTCSTLTRDSSTNCGAIHSSAIPRAPIPTARCIRFSSISAATFRAPASSLARSVR